MSEFEIYNEVAATKVRHVVDSAVLNIWLWSQFTMKSTLGTVPVSLLVYCFIIRRFLIVVVPFCYWYLFVIFVQISLSNSS